MQDLLSIRQKLENYKKIKQMTDATKLASITSYSFCTKRHLTLQEYANKLKETVKTIGTINIPFFANSESEESLIIFIGPSKELCASSFYNLGKYLQKMISLEKFKNPAFILVGKNPEKYTRLINKDLLQKTVLSIPNLKFETIDSISSKITTFITEAINSKKYRSITILNLKFKSFFLQEKKLSYLFPFEENHFLKEIAKNENLNELNQPIVALEGNTQNITNCIQKICLKLSILEELINSLMAEYASRFVAINKASSNASNLIDELTLQMNKIRQINITKQIAEISAATK